MWLLSARLAAFVLTLLLPIILVRVFSRTQIGTYRQIFLVVGTAINVLPLGFTMSAFYYLPRERERRRGLIVMNIVVFLAAVGLLAGAVAAFFPAVIGLVVGSNALEQYTPLIGITIFLWLFSGLLENIATANQDVKSSTVFIIFAQLSKTILILSAALFFRTIESLLYAAVLQGLVESSILLWYLRKAFPGFWKHFDGKVFREQTSYVAPLGLAGFAYSAQSDLHSYLVAEHFSVEKYAIYSTGSTQLPLVSTVRDSLVSVLLARVSSLQQRGQTDEIRQLMLRAVRKLSLLYIPVCVALWVLGREFLITIYTAKYLDSYPILALNALLLPLGAMITDPVLRAYASYRYVTLKVRLAMLLVLVALALSSIRYFGMVGVMLAYVFSVAVERFLLFGLSMHILKATWHDWNAVRDVLKYLAAALLSGLAVLAMKLVTGKLPPQAVLVAGSALFSATYMLIILLTGGIDEDERRMINRITFRYLRLKPFRLAA
jgi:O-antigen/teichoic acid export membrane protein